MFDLKEYFRRLRFDPNHHLGMGDIRLTLGQQEEIVAALAGDGMDWWQSGEAPTADQMDAMTGDCDTTDR